MVYIPTIFCLIGIKDTSNIPTTTTLGELGMDSLMVSEIKQTLDRNYNLILTINEIRLLTFGKLKELSGGPTNTKPVQVVKKVISYCNIITLFKINKNWYVIFIFLGN